MMLFNSIINKKINLNYKYKTNNTKLYKYKINTKTFYNKTIKYYNLNKNK